jgi:KDO2-lipid IV(A) lauroyltransferase
LAFRRDRQGAIAAKPMQVNGVTDMAKPRSVVADFAAYLAVRIVVCLVQCLSWEAAYGLADFLAWVLYHIDRRHRQVAIDNLRHAFPDRCPDAAAAAPLVRQTYRHFCRLLIEIILLPRKLQVHRWRQHLQLGGGRIIVDHLLSGRPLLLVTGHFGNWELGGYAVGLFGFSTYAIARPLDNPYLDRFLRRFRERTGQQILAKKGDFDRMEAILRSGGIIATLGDQDAGQRGLFVDFFHRPASTHKAIALLALEHNVPIVVILTPRVGRGLQYQVVAADLIRPEEYAGRPDAVQAITQRFTASLERVIRQYPEQYFWLHRRWKHQPPQRKRAPRAA